AKSFRRVLLDQELDPALAAQILTLPNENEMAGLFDSVDPAAIHSVHDALTNCLANELSNELLEVYCANPYGEYRVEHRDIGLRALRNCCLHYLVFGERDRAVRLTTEQYYQADNMTDTL
ncbi:aminopeptidase N, partial [Sodalis-like endosymbiont of Proechinophthirus fluctus]|uniref:aminopeptidase N C-terminal domain-containing protein n=1 Tax=Sodalis-like endosymbiont of Proechinophthirus fluctus TaxID=1462730 RepID=UPI0007A8E657